MKHTFRRMLVISLCGLLTLSLLVSPVHAEKNPPDQLDPPAEGEGEYLSDPSDPPPPDYQATGHPWVSVNLDGVRWPEPEVDSVRSDSASDAALKMSRRLWPRGSRAAVIVGVQPVADWLGASALAARLRSPMLVTPRDHLTQRTVRELRRLGPNRVFVVGKLRGRVIEQLRNNRLTPVRLRGDDRYETNAIVARKFHDVGRHPRTAVVVSGRRFAPSLSVSALASGRRFPVLITPQIKGNDRLRRLARGLGIRRTIVVGSTEYVSNKVVAGLPGVSRIAARTASATVNAVARRSWRLGMNGRPVLASHSLPERALVVGAAMGTRRQSPLIVTRGRELAPSAVAFLNDREPGRVSVIRAGVPQLALCQVSQGGTRRWFCAEQTLRREGYHVPRVDGRTDQSSVFAVFALEKVAGRAANGSFGEGEWKAMVRNPRHKVRRPDLPDTHVEIDIGKQLILLVKDGRVRNHIHTSTGKASTPTVRGTFTVYEKRNYMQANHMYRAIFFYGGYAIHGYPSVPTYPASHGCARTYNGNEDFLYPKVFLGERVATY